MNWLTPELFFTSSMIASSPFPVIVFSIGGGVADREDVEEDEEGDGGDEDSSSSSSS